MTASARLAHERRPGAVARAPGGAAGRLHDLSLDLQYWLSVHEYAPLKRELVFVGFENWTTLWADERFWEALSGTFTKASGALLADAVDENVFAAIDAEAMRDAIARDAPEAGDARAFGDVMARLEPDAPIRRLERDAVDALGDWDAEKRRQALDRARSDARAENRA